MFASAYMEGRKYLDCFLVFMVPGGEVESPCLAAAVFESVKPPKTRITRNTRKHSQQRFRVL